ncbi:MAG: hypothetical protein ACXVLQ_11470 [Bacteriovorax sp.]
MSNVVRVIDNLSGSVLLETSLEKLSDAYDFAALMEKEGLDISILAPGLAETLITSLGADDLEIAEYKKSLDNEIESHEDDFGCSICPPPKSV